MEALSEVVRAGKARYLGFSEWSSDQIEAAGAVPGVERFVSSQPQYSLLWRLPERAVIATCAAHGISQIVWSPLGQGVLTGKYRAGSAPPADSRAASERMGWAMGRFLTDEVIGVVERLRPIAAWPASRCRSSPSRGCSVSRTSQRRSSESRGPSSWTTTPVPPACVSTPRRSRRSTRRSSTSSSTRASWLTIRLQKVYPGPAWSDLLRPVAFTWRASAFVRVAGRGSPAESAEYLRR